MQQQVDDSDEEGADEDEDGLLDADELDQVDEEIEAVPSDLPEPLEWTLAECTLDAPLHRLHHIIFDENSKFMAEFFKGDLEPVHHNLMRTLAGARMGEQSLGLAIFNN